MDHSNLLISNLPFSGLERFSLLPGRRWNPGLRILEDDILIVIKKKTWYLSPLPSTPHHLPHNRNSRRTYRTPHHHTPHYTIQAHLPSTPHSTASTPYSLAFFLNRKDPHQHQRLLPRRRRRAALRRRICSWRLLQQVHAIIFGLLCLLCFVSRSRFCWLLVRRNISRNIFLRLVVFSRFDRIS